MNEHPNNILAREKRDREIAATEHIARVRAERARAGATARLLLAGGTPSPEALRTLALQYTAQSLVDEWQADTIRSGLFFEHPAAIDPTPEDGESFVIVFGEDVIDQAIWDAGDQRWYMLTCSVSGDSIYAALRIPSKLSELQRVGVETQRELLEEDRTESEGSS